MPSARTTAAITRLRAISARLRTLGSRMATTRLMKRVEDHVNRQKAMQFVMEKRFSRQSTRAVGGTRWRGLAPSTIRQRRRLGYGPGPILQRTVALKESAKAAVANTYRLNHASIAWSLGKVRVPYAAYHQRGAGRLPARPFMFQPDGPELAAADRMAAAEMRRLLRIATGRRRP